MRTYSPRRAWLLAVGYSGACWLVATLVGTTARVFEDPLATSEQLHNWRWWISVGISVATIGVAYGVVWSNDTLVFDRQRHLGSQLLFGVMWGSGSGLWLATLFVLSDRTGWAPWAVWLLTFGLISLWQALWHNLCWDVWVAPEHDTPESIKQDLEIIKQELPLDMLEFFILTPLPGSEDHQTLSAKGIWMDPDMNKYELEHVVTGHEKMSKEEWQGAYQSAWKIFYTPDHLETVLRRAYASGVNIRSLMPVLFWFKNAVPVEGLHPLQWGIFRIKHRKDRRSGLPIENPVVFYAKYAGEIARKATLLGKSWWELKRIVKKIEADPLAKDYMDQALTAVEEEDSEHMGLYNQNEAARVAVERELRVANKTSVQANGAAKSNGNGQPKLTVKSKKTFTAPDAANQGEAPGEKAPAA